MTQGLAFDELVLEVDQVLESSTIPVFRAEYNNVYIESINWSGDSGDVPDESVSILFASASFQTRQPGPDETFLDTGYLAYWDVVSSEGYLQETDFGEGAGPQSYPPTIDPVPLQTVPRNTSGLSFNFSFSDSDTALGGLTVDAVSLSEGLVPDASVLVTGSGLSRTVQFTSADTIGTATFQLSVNDGRSTTTRNVSVAVVNPGSPPELQLPASFTGCFGIAEALRGIGIIDLDSSTDFTLLLSVDQGTLDLSTDVPGGIQSSEVVGNGTGSLTITASKLAINNTLSNDFGLLYTAALSADAQLVLSLTDSDSLNDSAVEAISVLDDPYACWQLRYFSEAEIDGDLNTGELDDYDLDGTLNLIEFATNLDPTNPADRIPFTYSTIVSGPDTFFELTYHRRTQPGTLLYTFEIRNPTTGNWEDGSAATTLTAGPSPVNPVIDSVSYQTVVPVNGDTLLVRLKILKF